MQIIALDIETTGLSPKSHRIVEIAGVIYDTKAKSISGEFESLINPMRNVPLESTDKHGLISEHLSAAPTFEEFAPWLANLLNGRAVIAHNSRFDQSFVLKEFDRAGVSLTSSDWICTQKLSGGLSLLAACQEYEIELLNHHYALDDARACLEILRRIESDPWAKMSISEAPIIQGFVPPATLTRQQIGITPNRSPVRSFSRRVEFPSSDSEFTYLAVLNEFLEDMSISDAELKDLNDLCKELGISQNRQNELRSEYLAAIERSCMRDGILSASEAEILNRFARALGLTNNFEAKNVSVSLPANGSLICVTGTATIHGVHWDKAKWSAELSGLGYKFTDELRKTDGVSLLLQESEGSQSSKVSKAINWGIPRMTFEKFLGEIGGLK